MAYVHKYFKGEYELVAKFETEEQAVAFCEERYWKLGNCSLEIFNTDYVPSADRIADCEEYVMCSDSLYEVNW